MPFYNEMQPSSLSLQSLEEIPRYEVRQLGPAYNTRSHNNDLYYNFNNKHNYYFVSNLPKLPQKFELINNQGQNVQFNIAPEILHHINTLPNESRIFEIFNSAEKTSGGKKKKSIIKKKVVKNKQQKKRGGMPRPRPPQLMNQQMNQQLSDDFMNQLGDNSQLATPLLGNVPYYAQSRNPQFIPVTSPGPAYTLRDTRVGKHLDGLPNMVEYSDNLIYQLNNNELSHEQRNYMNQYMNAQNFTIVSEWCTKNQIPQKFNLYNSNEEMFKSFEFKNRDDTS